MADEAFTADEINAVKTCKRHVANGLDQRGAGYFVLIMHRGRGGPVGGHPEYLKAEKITDQQEKALALAKFLEPLLDSAVDVVHRFAEEYGWLHK